MRPEVCTLFEGSYHYGLAILANSLSMQGFQGTISAGFRGDLPPWAGGSKRIEEDCDILSMERMKVRFVRLSTDAHLTNYKPDFMLKLFERGLVGEDGLFYLDPDLVVCERWSFFENWLRCGIAVCEDVNSPMDLAHPRRVGWKSFFGDRGRILRAGQVFYANGGCVGVNGRDVEFLSLWRDMQLELWRAIGGAERAGIPGGMPLLDDRGCANCFDKTDQDVLNAAMDASEITVSFLNQQAMAFLPGKAILPHALGSNKPWQRNFLTSALRGYAPRAVDKQFWRYAAGPIRPFTSARVLLKRAELLMAAAVGRLNRRN